MVSIRKPNSRQSKGTSLRAVLLGFIILQSVNLATKMLRHMTSSTKVTDSVRKPQQKTPSHFDAKNKQPTLKIDHELKNSVAKTDVLTDADDHANLEPPKSRESTHMHVEVPIDEKPKTHAPPDTKIKESGDTDTKDEHNEHKIAPIDQKVDSQTAEVLAKHGSGPAQSGFVVDMVEERLHPKFRSLELPEPFSTKELGDLVPGVTLASCEVLLETQAGINPKCLESTTKMYAQNDSNATRYMCGMALGPKTIKKLESSCEEPVHLFAGPIPRDGHGMQSIVIQSQNGLKLDDSRLDDVVCDVPCKYEVDTDEKTELFVAETGWKITRTMDDPYFSDLASIERTDFKRGIFYSTTSSKSSVPLSYYKPDLYSVRSRPPVSWSNTKNQVASFLDESCGSRPRSKWLSALAAQNTVFNYGKCSHNAETNHDISTLDGRLAAAKESRFVLGFEVGTEKDHLTSVTYEALLSGAVPLIFGASNADRILPSNSAIFASNFNTWDEFAAYVKKVGEDKETWESFHLWRTDEAAIAAFEERLEFAKTDAKCRTCRWAYAKQYGLGWNHTLQSIQDTGLPRQLCTNSKGIIMKPFAESWVGEQGKHDVLLSGGDHDCSLGSKVSSTIDLEGGKIKRSVHHHDGITDINVEEIAHSVVVLRMSFDVRNSEGAYFRDTHTLVQGLSNRSRYVSSATIQDEHVKVTILANWKTSIRSSGDGIVEVPFTTRSTSELHFPLKLRTITEDMSVLHDKMTEFYPSSFTAEVVRDFVDPVRLYLAT